MSCADMQELTDVVRDLVEAELREGADVDALRADAVAWRDHAAERGVDPGPLIEDPAALLRWPFLSAWGWLVPMSTMSKTVFK